MITVEDVGAVVAQRVRSPDPGRDGPPSRAQVRTQQKAHGTERLGAPRQAAAINGAFAFYDQIGIGRITQANHQESQLSMLPQAERNRDGRATLRAVRHSTSCPSAGSAAYSSGVSSR
ncbi:hypothetical protein [Luteimonas deserti]|uniref:Uncharacterized protein n=1 Tax=Luteimonas deserti TaxID=2752306 RepID=A0A7Z0QNJ1_9GAMM|nr:hypothetical protein [Luteimonas deserti]NYZ61902.1 hypothetical protein [Luteimonas deserti]